MIGAVIQARMTSSRLPGKVMMEIQGRPVIDYLFERLSLSKKLQIVVLATTTNKEDDPLIEYAQKKGLPFFRGSEHDVLDRYYQAALQFGIKHIMRITADCPLIDPDICDHVIDVYLKEHVDYVVTGPTYAEGLDCEIFSFSVLEMAHKKADNTLDREHPTLYLHNHPETIKKITLQNSSDDSKYRITIDEPEDFEVVKSIIEALYRKGSKPFCFDEIRQYLHGHTEVFQKNAGIIRNEGLIICKASTRRKQ